MGFGPELTVPAALACATVMGWALQRGSTCMVAAVDDLATRRRPQQALTLFELVVWIAAALLVLRAAGSPLALSSGPWRLPGPRLQTSPPPCSSCRQARRRH
jgi:hypothetical protein